MTRINHALIMAAGRGQRMMPLTAAMPKAMAPYKDSTLIGESIRQIRKHIKYIHITVGYKGAMLAQHVIQHDVTSILNTEGQSNCWWIYNTLIKSLDEPIFVLTCDNIIELEFDRLEDDYFSNNEPACMIVPVKPVPGLEGDYIFHRGNIVTKLDRNDPSDIYCSGIQIINPHKINKLTREGKNFYSVWEQLIAQQQVITSRVYPSRWITVDTMEHLSNVAKSTVVAG
jgi:N-acetyl-alpha-D-muramate 1-phosphate uridylyltransferase